MAYADFTYYANTYLGTAIAESEFARLAIRASNEIDTLTFGRAAVETDATNVDKIKMAMCAVAEELHKQDQSGGADGITSESQGQYSVSYAANSTRAQTNQQKVEAAARAWLANTGLMYAGFYTGEYGGLSDSQ